MGVAGGLTALVMEPEPDRYNIQNVQNIYFESYWAHWPTCMIQMDYQKEPVISAPCEDRVLASHRVGHEQEDPQGWRRLVWEIEN